MEGTSAKTINSINPKNPLGFLILKSLIYRCSAFYSLFPGTENKSKCCTFHFATCILQFLDFLIPLKIPFKEAGTLTTPLFLVLPPFVKRGWERFSPSKSPSPPL